MDALHVWSSTPPAQHKEACTLASQLPASRRIVEDKENVIPANTPVGGPQLPQLAGGKEEAALSRDPLVDVTRHYEASSKGICIGAMGSSFGMIDVAAGAPASSCRQEAAKAQEGHASAAAEAAKARTAAHKRLALRAMR